MIVVASSVLNSIYVRQHDKNFSINKLSLNFDFYIIIVENGLTATDQNDLPGAVNDAVPDDSDSDAIGSSAASSAGKREKALAFTVPGDEERDPSLIRRHPPLRFRKLEDQQVEISQEMINMKQAEAEKRRSAVSQSITMQNVKLNISCFFFDLA